MHEIAMRWFSFSCILHIKVHYFWFLYELTIDNRLTVLVERADWKLSMTCFISGLENCCITGTD